MKAAARAARAMGCYVVNGFMGSPIWKTWYSFPTTTEEAVEAGFQRVRELWSPILDEFDEQAVKFALEVHPTEIAFDVYTTRRLLDTFNGRLALGLNFDPSHLVWQGIEPHLFLRDFADRIYHVHMKDVAVTARSCPSATRAVAGTSARSATATSTSTRSSASSTRSATTARSRSSGRTTPWIASSARRKRSNSSAR
ncbi:MAG: Sugar phosphate isomerase/epimerase [Candidatus Aminicenantes bacterium]|nr:Sugar phosphate isomerase/epimerase [Candidatus Aminicenantes bacterium]